ncbi:unnamed protein product, partial [marine sediment metagenome]
LTRMFIGLLSKIFYPNYISCSSPSSEGRSQYSEYSKTDEAPTFFEREFTVTAYCPCKICCGKWADGYTASGHKLQAGDKIVAAPMDIPFNTSVEIPGYGYAIVLDRGGVIKGNKLDVYFNTHQEALEWGVQKLKVKMWK